MKSGERGWTSTSCFIALLFTVLAVVLCLLYLEGDQLGLAALALIIFGVVANGIRFLVNRRKSAGSKGPGDDHAD